MKRGLLQAFDEAAHIVPGLCPVCRPSRTGRSVMVSTEEERHCPECGKRVDENGRCLGTLGDDGVLRMKVIVLEDN